MSKLNKEQGLTEFSPNLLQSAAKQFFGQKYTIAAINNHLKRVDEWQFPDVRGFTKKYVNHQIKDSMMLQQLIQKESQVAQVPQELLHSALPHDPRKIIQTALHFIRDKNFHTQSTKIQQEKSKNLAENFLLQPVPKYGGLILINQKTRKNLLDIYTKGKGFVTIFSKPFIYQENGYLYLLFSGIFDKSSEIINQMIKIDEQNELTDVQDVIHVQDQQIEDGIRLELAPDLDEERLSNLLKVLYQETGLKKIKCVQFQINKQSVNLIQVLENWTKSRIEEKQITSGYDLQSAIDIILGDLDLLLDKYKEEQDSRQINSELDVIQDACQQLSLIRCIT